MSRYIDAEKIKFEPIDIIVKGITLRTVERMATETEIDDMPAADVEEVRHGKWRDEREDFGTYVCSVCNRPCGNQYNYCPNCGAKMDGEKNESIYTKRK